MSGSIEDSQADWADSDRLNRRSDDESAPHPYRNDPINQPERSASANAQPSSNGEADDNAWDEMDRVLSDEDAAPSSSPRQAEPHSSQVSEASKASMMAIAPSSQPTAPDVSTAPLGMVETAFLASTASLLWLVSYYLSIGPWMRIFFPAPIALVYLRWGHRASWMAAIVSCLLLSVLMGPYLSLLFLIPYGLLGVQLGFLWRRGAGWPISIGLSTIVSTFSFFFRIWILSTFIGEDLWVYLTGRITDLLGWLSNRLVDWGILDIGMLGQPDVTLVQIAAVIMVICSDIVYLFTVHLAAWLLFERLGNTIPEPPTWVKILLEEE